MDLTSYALSSWSKEIAFEVKQTDLQSDLAGSVSRATQTGIIGSNHRTNPVQHAFLELGTVRVGEYHVFPDEGSRIRPAREEYGVQNRDGRVPGEVFGRAVRAANYRRKQIAGECQAVVFAQCESSETGRWRHRLDGRGRASLHRLLRLATTGRSHARKYFAETIKLRASL